MSTKIGKMNVSGGMRRISALTAIAFASCFTLSGQIALDSVTVSATQAILQYTSPLASACSIQVADMNREISIASVSQANGLVAIQTAAPHGLVAGAVIYLENSGVWNGWQVLTSVPSSTSFVFANAASGGASGGDAGVLVDDVNPALFSGANLDSRPGSISTGQTTPPGQLIPLAHPAGRSRTFVIGKRDAEIALDGNRYSRALQAYSRHHFTLTCGTQTFDQEFSTANIPVGETYGDGPPVDPANPGSYSYPTIRWSNQAQALIDPLSGILSRRVTGPSGAASSSTAFGTAIDLQGSSWTNPQQSLNNANGAATFTPPCASGTCPLFLRADNLSIYGGASYSFPNSGSSLDWYQVAFTASISNGSCTGDDCKVSVCLTINGQTCATPAKDQTIGITPASYTVGTTNLMDLWQGSGPPAISRVDANEFTGTVNYNAATKTVTWASGSYFDLNWTAGSRITIAGASFTIASLSNEAALTLVSGPTSSFTGGVYSASNFGVLIWKKTANLGAISISSTAYLYGSSAFATWGAAATDSCSSNSPVTVGGKTGYNCFIGQELYWIAADGSQANDLGKVQTSYRPTTNYGWGMGYSCGQGSQAGQFDPQNGDIWYCMFPVSYGSSGISYGTITQAHYMGSHSAYTPGQALPDCALNGGSQPCIQFTNMMPAWSSTVSNSGPAFNPDFAASGAVLDTNIIQGGIDPSTSTMLIYNFMPVAGVGGGQDWPAWIFMYSLGDRTPSGTGPNSFQIVAATSSYRHPPLSWCSIHNAADVPYSGWAQISSNDLTIDGAYGTYIIPFATGQAALNPTVGAAGGLTSCPTNPLGVTGNNCTMVAAASQPARQADGATPQNLQVGDVMSIGTPYQGGEYLRVLAINSLSPLQFVVQRNYLGAANAPTNQSGNSLRMVCGLINFQGARQALWNYVNDPYGANAGFSTIVADATLIGGHHYAGKQVNVVAGGAQYNLGPAVCPSSLTRACLQVRTGTVYTAQFSPNRGFSISPQFDGVAGYGPGDGDDGNSVDSHPGPCFGTACFDAHPLIGGYAAGVAGTGPILGTSAAPYTLVAGQLWKISGANNVLHRKIVPTFAYVGRNPLVDVSGPSSSIGTASASQFTYCYAYVAGECYSGSSAGDVYVNAPHVQYPWCWYPGIAVQPDDVTSICIGDLGSHTANVVEFNASGNDWTGAATRRLGPAFIRYNQMHIFWNLIAGPSLSFFGSYGRWLDGVRSDALLASLPPMPQADSVSRNTFVPIALTLSPPPGLPLASAVVEFGYAENGGAGAYYCTSRQETCIASSAGINPATPFFYEQSEQFAGVPCAAGCTVTVPAVPQRILYYRWKYLSAAGQAIAVSAAHAVATP
jgi:hypothetical protein